MLGVSFGFVAGPSILTIVAGQVDSFDSDLSGWETGSSQAGSPNWEADGGRLGTGDGFMRVTSKGGEGAGSRLSVYNLGQWAGDYTTAGVDSITFDVKNLGESELRIRLVVESSGPRYITSEFFPLPVGKDWVTASFSLLEADLTNIPRTVDYASVMADVTSLRIVHSDSTDFPPVPIVAEIGVDNILAGTRSTVGTEEVDLLDPFTVAPVYPNPASTRATVDVISEDTRNIRVSVIDLLGREVQVAYDRPTNGLRTSVNLETTTLPSGLYIVRVESGDRSQTKTLSVVH